MQKEELYEIRKQLIKHKDQPESLIPILLSLHQIADSIPKQAIEDSKINKTLKTLIDAINQETKTPNEDQTKVLDISNLLITNFTKKLQVKSASTAAQKPKKTKEKKENNEHLEQAPTYSGYTNREPFRNGILKLITQNCKTYKNDHPDCTVITNIDEISFDLAKRMENVIYQKYIINEKSQAECRYHNDMKTLAQHLKSDYKGELTVRIIKDQFKLQRACELKSEDWAQLEVIHKQEQMRQEELEKNRTDFYHKLRIEEMKNVPGKLCKNCSQTTVYLTSEKQTRCADEPTTKFYECFNCGNKFRT